MQIMISDLSSFLQKKYRIVFHVLFVAMVLTFWILYAIPTVKDWISFVQLLAYASVYVGMSYFNMYVLFNRFFSRGRMAIYFALTLLSFLAGFVIIQLIYSTSWKDVIEIFSIKAIFPGLIINAITFSLFTGLGITFQLFTLLIEREQKISALVNENLKAELNNLKSQISPHFLFNTLNNLYVLTKTQPQIAAETVLGLSDLMRYQLNECSQERVPLTQEMQYIRNLLGLEQLRKDKWTTHIHFPDTIPYDFHIEPLLFVTLVENAIKHGSQQLETGNTELCLTITDRQLTFRVSNSKPEISTLDQKHKTGIGLVNLKRRLELLYPGRHVLTIEDNTNTFTSTLVLSLQ